ncbi:MAG: hypothetical protein OER88_10115, partial [Planctomycetota bacterium]|nr:hypothetical protein [Planctomycetota bacterium]
GMRLPTYLAAGMLHAPFFRFLAIAVGATLAWTLILLTSVQWIGREIFPLLGRARWPLAIAALATLVLLQRSGRRRGRHRVVSRFEFWPPWLFYLPVAPYYAWLSVRYRGWLIPTCANPAIEAGGLIGESKFAILSLVPEEHSDRMATTAFLPAEDAAVDGRTDAARAAMAAAGLDFPIVAKPDLGQRGAGIRPLDDEDELAEYLAAFPRDADLILQRRIDPEPSARARPEDDYPFVEAGVFWWRLPGADRGEVPSLTLKQLPSVVGDGKRTLRELIEADPRASRVKSMYFAKAAAPLDDAVAEGQRVPLVFAGNHCQGAIFRDGRDYLGAPFADRIDALAQSMPGFAFGRFDVRFASFDAFLAGEFKIIEINGVGGEMTHIWDPGAKLGESYLTLFRQWRNAFRIGRAAADEGTRPMKAPQFFAEWRRYRRLAVRYPAAR